LPAKMPRRASRP